MKYYILLDSSNTSLTVGLCSEEKIIDSTSYEAWQTQSEHMIPELDALLSKYSVDKNDIKGVVVSIGPGSYTGVRIAITISKVIGVALNVPVYPVSALQILKMNKKPSICLINARSNRSYIGVYEDDKCLLQDCIMTNDEVKEYIAEHEDYAVCGNCKYLGIDGYISNIAEEMFSLLGKLKPCEDSRALKPVYLKD
jgi:tRNA threonylcarbamoyl adenosine modification protein YeaZ